MFKFFKYREIIRSDAIRIEISKCSKSLNIEVLFGPKFQNVQNFQVSKCYSNRNFKIFQSFKYRSAIRLCITRIEIFFSSRNWDRFLRSSFSSILLTFDVFFSFASSFEWLVYNKYIINERMKSFRSQNLSDHRIDIQWIVIIKLFYYLYNFVVQSSRSQKI